MGGDLALRSELGSWEEVRNQLEINYAEGFAEKLKVSLWGCIFHQTLRLQMDSLKLSFSHRCVFCLYGQVNNQFTSREAEVTKILEGVLVCK